MRLPRNVDEIDTPWLKQAFANAGLGTLQSSRILHVQHGTATKIPIEAEFVDAAGKATKRTFWIKTGFENHAADVGQQAVYAGEVHYYSKLAGLWDTRTPRCLFAEQDPETGNSLIILEDLLALKPRFFEPVEPISVTSARGAVQAMARYHASSWNDPRLSADGWLATGGAWVHSNVIGWLYSDFNWEYMSGRPRFRVLPEKLRDRDLLRDTHTTLIGAWRETAQPFCLSHGDAHVGQGYELPDGEVRLLDWQCVTKNSWANDYAYFTVSALDIADRRAVEKDLLAFYLEELKGLGVTPPAFAAAFELYRAYTFHGIGWVCCKPEMQSEENCAAIGERFAAALLDLDCIAAVRAGPESLR
jgi:Ecdysteroid kinase-like family